MVCRDKNLFQSVIPNESRRFFYVALPVRNAPERTRQNVAVGRGTVYTLLEGPSRAAQLHLAAVL